LRLASPHLMMARLRVLLRELAAYVTIAHNPGSRQIT